MIRRLWMGGVVFLMAGCSDDGTPWQDSDAGTSAVTGTDSVGHTDDDDDDDDEGVTATSTSGGTTGTSAGTDSVSTSGEVSTTGTDSADAEGTGSAGDSGDTGYVEDSGGTDSVDDSTTGDSTGGESSSGESSTGDPMDEGYCPGAEPWPSEALLCERAGECPVGWECSPTGEEPDACGACMAPDFPCTGDETCSDGDVCERFEDPCACEPNALGCMAPCQERGCGDGETCRDDGHCAPQSCEDEWSCGEGTQCEPLADSADEHGCTPISCEAGWACGDGAACEPEDRAADAHGCVAVHCSQPDGMECQDPQVCLASEEGSGCQDVTCEDASDCACGSCVEGICRSAPGVCVPPPPPAAGVLRSSR